MSAQDETGTGGFQPPAGGLPPPPCFRCGRPYGEHAGGVCPVPPLQRLSQDLRSGATVGFAIFLGVVACAAGLVWIATSSSAQACTLGGQLEGQTCYPRLEQIHAVAGPAALVVLVVALVLYITGRKHSP